jgi:subtilisin family serine protease
VAFSKHIRVILAESVDFCSHSCPAMKRLRYLAFFALLSAFPAASRAASVNDPLFAQQWSLRQVNAGGAWDVTMGDSSVVVAVIDTGVDTRNPDFKGALWTNSYEVADNGIDDDNNGYIDDIHGWNFQTDSSDTLPMRVTGQSTEAYGHGTAVASIIAARANDGFGMAGIAPKVRIMPLVVLDGDGFGSNQGLAEAIRYAAAKKARIINISVTGYEDADEVRFALYEAQQLGVLIVTAVGNSGDVRGEDLTETPVYPACNGKNDASGAMIRVTGTDTLDQRAPHANFGADCTDIAAPGHELLGAHPIDLPKGSTATTTPDHVSGLTGTSVASPMVAGTAALIASVNPELTASEIRNILLTTVDTIEPRVMNGEKGQLGYGRLNAERAVKKAAGVQAATPVAVKPVQPANTQKAPWDAVFRFWFSR